MMLSLGSSPRVRGKQPTAGDEEGKRGLIPACAGKTFLSWAPRSVARAHPRVCGENPIAIGWRRVVAGSSPRVRGKRPKTRPSRATNRLIPACAGKTPETYRQTRPHTAHPRVCGENASWKSKHAPNLGSSPRVRGKQRPCWKHCNSAGLIPACAGKTCGSRGSRRACWAHPRVCGENRIGVSR